MIPASVLDPIYGAEVDGSRFGFLVDGALAGRPAAFVSAPGRTELGGNHTDHNHGVVLAAAVNRDAAALVHPRHDSLVILQSEGFPGEFRVDLSNLEPVPAERETTGALIRGVAAELVARGYSIGGFEGRMTSTVLKGSGLSSSAAVEVLIGGIFNLLFNDNSIAAEEIARIGQIAENRHFGKPCGLMDQMASAVGGIASIDFNEPESPTIRRVPLRFAEWGYDLAVVDVREDHADLTDDYAAMPVEMKAVAKALGGETLRDVDPAQFYGSIADLRKVAGDRAVIRAFHFFHETKRAEDLAVHLENDDSRAYFEGVRASSLSSWRYLQNIFSQMRPKHQGIALALALSEDFLAGDGATRVHGGGFAGTIQTYLPKGRYDEYVKLMEPVYGAGCVHQLRVRERGVSAAWL